MNPGRPGRNVTPLASPNSSAHRVNRSRPRPSAPVETLESRTLFATFDVPAPSLGPDPTAEPAGEPPPHNTAGLLIDSRNNTVTTSLISGNLRAGIRVNPGGDNTLITADRIGTDAAGTTAYPNLGTGITATGVTGLLVGGTTPAARNLISGNGGDGVLI